MLCFVGLCGFVGRVFVQVPHKQLSDRAALDNNARAELKLSAVYKRITLDKSVGPLDSNTLTYPHIERQRDRRHT